MHSYWCIQNQIHIAPSGASLVMNLLMQNAMYIVQYVCCIMYAPIGCIQNRCILVLLACYFKGKSQLMLQINFTQPYFNIHTAWCLICASCIMHNISILHNIGIMHKICITHNICIIYIFIWMLQKQIQIKPCMVSF